MSVEAEVVWLRFLHQVFREDQLIALAQVPPCP
jgi:hypothetical protein